MNIHRAVSKSLCFSFVAILLSVNSGRAESLALASGGNSRYRIVLPAEALPSEIHAAEEFQEHIEKISGARLPVGNVSADGGGPFVFIGFSDAAKSACSDLDAAGLGGEGFIIRTVGNNLILAGGKPRGTMYAVFTFLEEVLGCRWYTSTVSRIPRMPDIQIPQLDKKDAPAFEYREPHWGDALDADWAARNRCNSSSARLGEEYGGRVSYRGVHTFYPFIPPDSYYDDHPEWYSVLSNKKRTWEYGQLCLSNPEVMKRMTDKLMIRMGRDKEGNIFCVSQNDWHVACVCPPCKAIDEHEGTHAGTLVYFINDIAERTSKSFPDKYVGTLAYTYTEKPPLYARPGKNVVIRLCNMNDVIGCDAHPLTECEENRRFRENLIGWSKIADKIYIWDYVTDFSNYQMPFPVWYANAKDLRFFRDYGIDGIFEQGATSNKAAAGSQLTAWLEAKLLWNPDLNLDSLMADFIQGYYGPAAEPMLEYHRFLLNEAAVKNMHFMLYSPPIIPLFSKPNLARMDELITKAEDLAQSDFDVAQRVEEIRLNWQYVHLNQPLPRVVDGNVFKPVPGSNGYANPGRLEAFMKRINAKNTGELWEFRGSRLAHYLMQANVNDHAIVTLENAGLKLSILPSVGGRIFSLVHKKSGRDLMRKGTTADRIFPGSGGYTDPFLSDHPGRREGFENYSYIIKEFEGGKKIVLSTVACYRGADDAVALEREIELPDTGTEIRITTRMRLLADTRRPMQIITQPEFDLGNWVETRFGIMKSGGGYDFHDYPEPGDWGYRSAHYRGREIASGKWCLINQSENLGVVSSFNPEEVESCNIWVNPKTNAVGLRLVGFMKPGESGAAFTLHQKLEIIDNLAGSIN